MGYGFSEEPLQNLVDPCFFEVGEQRGRLKEVEEWNKGTAFKPIVRVKRRAA
jgi:hypothetical protein